MNLKLLNSKMTKLIRLKFLFVGIVFLLLRLTFPAHAVSLSSIDVGSTIEKSIDISLGQKIPLPLGRWQVMALYKSEIPLTGGNRSSQEVKHIALLNQSESAPIQFITFNWTESANVNWTGQPCETEATMNSKKFKDTFNTTASALVVKCSGSTYFNGVQQFLNGIDSQSIILQKSFKPLINHPRMKPESLVELSGYVSKHRSDRIYWHAYINPISFGLNLKTDTDYVSPSGDRQQFANELLQYAMEWNKPYMLQIENNFFGSFFGGGGEFKTEFSFNRSVEKKTFNLNQVAQGKVQGFPLDQSELVGAVFVSDAPGFLSFAIEEDQGLIRKAKTNEGRALNLIGGLQLFGTNSNIAKTWESVFQGMRPYAVGKRNSQIHSNEQGTKWNLSAEVLRETTLDTPIGQRIVFVVELNEVALDGGKFNEKSTIHLDKNLEIPLKRVITHIGGRPSTKPNFTMLNAFTNLRQEPVQMTVPNSVSQPIFNESTTSPVVAILPSQPIKPTPSVLKEGLNKVSIRAHALVIGNAAYGGSGRLDNPVNDAKSMSAKLRGLGFVVTELLDTNRAKLVSGLAQFSRSAENADMTLLFYSGHGVQVFGTNYVLPIDIDQSDIAQATLQGVSLNSIIEQFMPGKTKLVFLDACRTNPLMRTASRGLTKGLAPISVSEGTLISYAAKDGQEAFDGTGQKNSPFTSALLDHLSDPDDIAVVLRKVRSKVLQSTGGKQQPWEYGSLTGGALVLSAIKPK